MPSRYSQTLPYPSMYLFSPTLKKKALGRNRHRTSRRAHNPQPSTNSLSYQLSVIPPLSCVQPPLPAFRLSIQFLQNAHGASTPPTADLLGWILSYFIPSLPFHPFNSTSTSSPLPPHPLPSPPQTSSPNFLPIARFPTQTRSQTPYLGDFFSLGSVQPLVTISGECRCCCC